MASTHLPSLTKQVRDLHSPIPSQAVPSQHLYPTHLQHSPGSFSSPWSPPQAAAYQPLLVVPATATGVQGSRAGGGEGWCCWGPCLEIHLPEGICISSLSMSQGLTCPGGLSSCHATFTCTYLTDWDVGNQEVYFCLGFHFTLLFTLLRALTLQLFGTRISFLPVYMPQKGSSSLEDLSPSPPS